MVNIQRDRLDSKLAARWMTEDESLSTPDQDPVFLVTVIRPLVVHMPEEFSEPPPQPEQESDDTPLPAIPEPLSATIECPSCGGRLKVKEKHRGRWCVCPACKTSFMIPFVGG